MYIISYIMFISCNTAMDHQSIASMVINGWVYIEQAYIDQFLLCGHGSSLDCVSDHK